MRATLTALLLFAALAPLPAEVKPSALFSDHVVLQSGMAVPVWGTAAPGERVTVTLNGQKQSATASADGKWMVRLKSLKPGGPFQMTIAGTNTIAITDVLVGEVWLGSGQSNMAFTVSKKQASYAGLIDEEREIAEANYPRVRMFTGKSAKTYEPQSEIQGEWLICNPQNVPGFSAVGYLFSRDLHRELKQPVGFVTLAFGASTAESWIRRETVAADPLLKPMLDHFDAAVQFYRTKPDAPSSEAPKPPQTINARPGAPPARQRDPVQDQHNPTVLFNGMIHPVIPYAIRGAIWYQGESIVGGKEGVALYPHVMETLIKDWRKLWGQGDFPFYVVQLPALQNISNNPLVREGQAASAFAAAYGDGGDDRHRRSQGCPPAQQSAAGGTPDADGAGQCLWPQAGVLRTGLRFDEGLWQRDSCEVLAPGRRPGGQRRAAEVVHYRRRGRKVRARRSQDRGRYRGGHRRRNRYSGLCALRLGQLPRRLQPLQCGGPPGRSFPHGPVSV